MALALAVMVVAQPTAQGRPAMVTKKPPMRSNLEVSMTEVDSGMTGQTSCPVHLHRSLESPAMPGAATPGASHQVGA
jgi:hypothetical protein